MESLLLKNRKGFAFAETLVGFVLFSSLLLVYLPSYQRESLRLSKLRLRVQQAHLWSDLSDLSLVGKRDAEWIDIRIQEYEKQVGNRISYFDCQEGMCSIAFEDGQVFQAGWERTE